MIPARWEDAWIERLRWVGPQNCVSTRLTGLKTCRLEVYGLGASDLRKLVREFGGSVKHRRYTTWMASQQHAFCLPLSPFLCLASGKADVPYRFRHLPRLQIPAGMAFGTGEHATTGMCLRQLMKHLPESRCRVLDAGTGSGILALAAALAGHHVTAVDFDPDSIRVAMENAALNESIPSVRWVRTDICKFKPKSEFDLIVANLFSDLLIRVLPQFRRWLKAGSPLIVSGILHEQEKSVATACKQNSFKIRMRYRKGKWVCLVLT